MKNALKDFLYRGIFNLGAALTPRSYLSGLEMATHLRELLAKLQITCVLDVGANEGQYRNFLRRRCGYTGDILSFEPARQTFKVLQDRAAHDSHWKVFNCALGSVDGEKVFNVMQDTRMSSFLEPQSLGWNYLDAMNIVDHRETVTIHRLDGFMREAALKNDLSRVYLKVDTQGHDLEVIEGLGVEIGRVAALQTEISVRQLYKGMTSMHESIPKLNQLGFEVTGLFRVARDDLFRVVEFDCVAVNTKLASRLLGNENTSLAGH